MTDSLTPEDLQRIEESLDTSKLKSVKELQTTLSKQKDGKPVFPKKLRDFLLERNKDNIIKSEERERIRTLARAKGRTLTPEDTIERGVWKGRSTYYIKNKKGKIKTWGVDKMRKPDFNAEIRRHEQNIKTLETKLQKEKAKIEQLKKYKEEQK